MTRTKRSCKQIFTQGINWFLVALLSIALALTACSPTEQTPTRYVFDDLGRLVAINGTPQRIISLAPSNTEILFALGLGDKVVGVTDYCNYPPEAQEKEKVMGYSTPNIEKIIALNPDLILAGYGNPINVVYTLEGLGLPVFGIKTTDLDDLLDDIRRIGEITDKAIEAQVITAEMAVKIQAVTNQTEELEESPKVFYLFDTYGGLWTVGQGTFIHELIEKGGGVNICQNLTGYTTIGIEEVIARNPEIIITGSYPGVYEWAMNETALNVTDARQNDRVYTCDDDLAQRPG
ncbi:MAG TPA: ABC transporter substrate-binding protein, partial [Dehalococcoidia bacterium]|nr:ABC transporter substrate-binding protein [Dehalococcoidia bacterium]